MATIKLSLKKSYEKPHIPVEAEVISPDVFVEKSLEEIKQLLIWRGNKQLPLGDVFDISIEPTSLNDLEHTEIILDGELSRFKRIGQKMTGGKISVLGSIGMHLGFEMKDGLIIVDGSADDFAGANMTGGFLHIKGNAGHYLGGSIRGDWRGMKGGKIKVDGNVGNETGIWMRKGLIEIGGNAPMFLGMHLHRGTIIVHGDVTERAGAEMTGGTIVILGKLVKNLPSFEFIKKHDELILDDQTKIKGPLLEFKGDFAERKQGSLYLLEKNNKHLL
ncbi:MAG: formylmethanofuran dehydrogenase subunit C [Candidatus Heimdallarchaeota archaeon]